MIITKDCDEFQELLRKVKHLEDVIRVSKYYCGCDPYKEEPPQFKVGDWIAFDDYRKIFYCIYIEKENLFDDCMNPYHIDYCSKATPQEIESHLKKICDEKYIGKKVGSLCSPITDTIQYYQSFSFARDQMWYTGKHWGILVYNQGKFAEIVSDKKKLPKTKEEFKDFLTQYYKCGNIRNFLNQYED